MDQGEPIKMIVELDEPELSRQVERANDKINSGSSQKGYSGPQHNDLVTAAKQMRDAKGHVSELIAEVKKLIQVGAKRGIEMPQEMRSLGRFVAATMGMGEREEGGGVVRYGKHKSSSERAIKSIVERVIQQAVSGPLAAVPAATASVASTVSNATGSALPMFVSPAEKNRREKEQARQDREIDRQLKATERANAKKNREFEREQKRKEREDARIEKRKEKAEAKRENDEVRFWTKSFQHGRSAWNARHRAATKGAINGPPPVLIGGGGGIGGFFKNIAGNIAGGGGGMGQLFGALGFGGGGGGGGGGGITGTIGMMGPWGAGIAAGITLLQSAIKGVVGIFKGFINVMEGIMSSFGKLNPVINAQMRIFDLQVLMYKRQVSAALQPAMESWLNLKRIMLSIMRSILPLIELLGVALQKLLDALSILLVALKVIIPQLARSVASFLLAMALVVGPLTDMGKAAMAAGNALLKVAAGGSDDNPWKSYNQAFVDAFKMSPKALAAADPEYAKAHGLNSDAAAKAARRIGSSWLSGSPAGQPTPNIHLGPSGGSTAPPAGAKHAVPKAALPRMDIKNSFQMKMDYDKMLQETISQVRGFLLQSVFGVRQEVAMMQAQLDPRGLL